MKRYLSIKTIVIVALVIAAAILPKVFTDPYQNYLFNILALQMVGVLGLYLMMSLGLVSFGQAGFVGIGAYTVAILTTQYGVNFWISLIAGGVLAAIVALIIGSVALRLRGAYFFVMSFAMGQALMYLFLSWTGFTKGPNGISGIPRPSELFGSYNNFYYLSLILLIITLVAIIAIRNSRYHSVIKAVNLNSNFAAAFGISAFKVKMVNWILCCFVTGLAGGLTASLVGFIDPNMFGTFASMNYVIPIIFGGTATLAGPVFGTVVVFLLEEALEDFAFWEPLVFGLIVIVVLVVSPDGVILLAQKTFKRIRMLFRRIRTREVS